MPTYPGVAARLFDTPLLAHPGKAVAMARALGPRLLGGPLSVDGPPSLDHISSGRTLMGELGDPLAQHVNDREALYRHGPVAVIHVEGTLVHKGKWVGAYSGETSYEGIRRQVNAARRDASVRGVVIEVDSCGGEVSGAFDCAEAIAELAAEKPTVAILTDHAYSAGYLLASAARQIVIPETGGCGSIGVIMMHADFSRHLEADGIKVTVIKAGEHKGEGNPFEPLPEEVAETYRADLQHAREIFAAVVGRYRGERLTREAALATEAGCYTGAAAVAAGLADAVARPSEAFEAFVNEIDGGTTDRERNSA